MTCADKTITAELVSVLVKTKWTLWQKSYRRIAIFGAGKHTQWLLAILGENALKSIAAIFDDQPQTSIIRGIKVATPTVSARSQIEAIAISTDTHVETLTKRARAIFGPDIPILFFYDDLPPGPYAKAMPASPNLVPNATCQSTKILHTLVVGAGRAGSVLHLPVLQGHPNVIVGGVCDVNPSSAKALAAQYNGVASYSNYYEALKARTWDLIILCTPPTEHWEQTQAAFDAGAHVLLEKPLCVTEDELIKFNNLTENGSRRFSVIHNQKFTWATQAAIKLAKEGAIGEVVQVDRVWIRNGYDDRMIPDRGFWAHQLPGGRWAETLPHDLYCATQFVGDLQLTGVEAKQSHRLWPWLPADDVFCRLASPTALVTIRFVAATKHRLSRHMIIRGTDGALITDGATLVQYPCQNRAAPKIIASSLLPDPQGVYRGAGHYAAICLFIKSILDETPPPTTWHEIYHTMKTSLAVGKAIIEAANITNNQNHQ